MTGDIEELNVDCISLFQFGREHSRAAVPTRGIDAEYALHFTSSPFLHKINKKGEIRAATAPQVGGVNPWRALDAPRTTGDFQSAPACQLPCSQPLTAVATVALPV
jgi:hypothetical protein